MQLTQEEQDILNGAGGETLARVMKSVIQYGEAFGASRLVPIEGMPHMVTSFGANTTWPYMEMIDQIIAAGLKTRQPFTVDPRPLEYEYMRPNLLQRLVFDHVIFGRQAEYEAKLASLGLKDTNAFSCTCYMKEVGNIPARGERLAWSESSAVVYANSVLGARSNRNSSGIDLMCDIIGKAPEFGLLTDEGRQADWMVEIRVNQRPNPQLLGSAIGLKVVEDVPYITGLDFFLGRTLNQETRDFLKDMGAAAASNGAVGLCHVENITPEAIEFKRGLLKAKCRTYVIDDAELERVRQSYPVIWKKPQARPRLAFIGCPHLSRQQIAAWAKNIDSGLKRAQKQRVRVPTYLCAAPDVAQEYRAGAREDYERMLKQGVHLTSICALMYMNNPLCAREPVITNSNKLRTYSTARFYPDEDILQIILNGKLEQGEQA
jgi:predicted aconitase